MSGVEEVSPFEEDIFALIGELARPIWNARAMRAKLDKTYGIGKRPYSMNDGRQARLEISLREIDDIVRKYVKEHTDGQTPDPRVSPGDPAQSK